MRITDEMVKVARETFDDVSGSPLELATNDAWRAALEAALAVDGMALQGWQDISTAPKDGTPILWSCGDDKMSVIHWPEYDLCFEGGYWQPLPQPPAASDREERRPPPKEKP